MERMVEAVPDSDYQVLQNFLTHSSWDYRAAMDRVAHKTDALLDAEIGTGLYIDESAFAKKGDQSVGVARQWNGRLGKQDNCQVRVFGALGRGDRVSLIDARLYLPKEWTDDPHRCDRADVPRAERVRYHSDARPIEVRKWVKKQLISSWRKKTLRTTTKGNLVVEVLHQRVWLWDKKSPTAHCWHLIVRREVESPGTLKYSLSNAPAQTSVRKLARMQAQRFWIERAFQDAKSHIGMAQYQARQWPSWHRHMALVMMAMLFMLQERLDHSDLYPLLSCYDIQILLATTLPDRGVSEDEVVRQMHVRHQQRQALIEAASRESSRKSLI